MLFYYSSPKQTRTLIREELNSGFWETRTAKGGSAVPKTGNEVKTYILKKTLEARPEHTGHQVHP